jgi:hypothetical protein
MREAAMIQKSEAPDRWHGEGAKETAWMRRECSAIRKRNIAADESDVRLDLLRSLKILLPQLARERLLEVIRELVREGQISKGPARELRALCGGADYA